MDGMERVIQVGRLDSLGGDPDEQALEDFFAPLGHVIKAQIWTAVSGKKHAFITFSTESEAKNALSTFSLHAPESAPRQQAPGLVVIMPQTTCIKRYNGPERSVSSADVPRFSPQTSRTRQRPISWKEESMPRPALTSADDLLADIEAAIGSSNVSLKLRPPPLRLPAPLPSKPAFSFPGSGLLPSPSSPSNMRQDGHGSEPAIPTKDSFAVQERVPSPTKADAHVSPSLPATSSGQNNPRPPPNNLTSVKRHDEFMDKVLASHAEQCRKIRMLERELTELRKCDNRNVVSRTRALDLDADLPSAIEKPDPVSVTGGSGVVLHKRHHEEHGDVSGFAKPPDGRLKRRRLGDPGGLQPDADASSPLVDKALEVQLSEATKKIQELEDQRRTAIGVKEALSSQATKLHDSYNAEQSRNECLQRKLDSMRAIYKDLLDTMTDTRASLDKMKQERTDTTKLQRLLAEETADRKAAEEKAYAHDVKAVNLEAETRRLTVTVTDLEGRLNYANGVIRGLESELTHATKQKAEAESAIAAEKSRSSSLEKSLGNAGSAINHLETELAHTVLARDEAQKRVEVLLKELKSPVAPLLLDALLLTDKMVKEGLSG